jgi:hypothetical protein
MRFYVGMGRLERKFIPLLCFLRSINVIDQL